VQNELPGLGLAAADADRLLRAARRAQQQRDERQRQARLRDFAQTVGQRFAGATLESYQVTTGEQRKAVDALQSYAANIRERVADGDGIVLFGSAGSGKTHLLVAAGKVAIEAGLLVAWANGQDLFARFRAAIDGDGSESKIVRELVAPDVLILDDVLPPGGNLTEYQATCLYRIVDARYCALRPTWATMNVAGGEEAEHGMGAQVVDRLRHGALTLFCNWASYRKVQA